MNSTHAKEGQRVLFKGDISKYGSDYQIICDKKISGLLANSQEKAKYYCGSPDYALVIYTKVAPFLKIKTQLIKWEDIDEVPDSYQEFNNLFEKEISVRVAKFQSLYKTESTTSYKDHTFFWEDKGYFSTIYNYADKGGELIYLQQCCAFTRTTLPVQIWIPKIWLNLYEYSEADILKWFAFLKNAIGYECEWLKDCDLSQGFVSKVNNKTGITEAPSTDPMRILSVYQNGLTGFSSVKFKASTECYLTYLNFICLRYLYNDSYWNIPGLAMQIKDALGDRVSCWEALLMAHLYKQYDGYYCLVQNQFTSELDKTVVVNPFQKKGDVFTKLTTTWQNKSMNTSFEYIRGKVNTTILTEFFKKQDYVGLYNYLRTIIPEEKK